MCNVLSNSIPKYFAELQYDNHPLNYRYDYPERVLQNILQTVT